MSEGREEISVIPVHELLNRIRWDTRFGEGYFEIGYFDHVARRILRIPLRETVFEEGNRFSFQVRDSLGELQTIPFHRVREVLKDGLPIWRRPDPSASR